MRKSPNTKLVEEIEQLLESYQAFQPKDHTGAIAKLTISAVAGAIASMRSDELKKKPLQCVVENEGDQ